MGAITKLPQRTSAVDGNAHIVASMGAQATLRQLTTHSPPRCMLAAAASLHQSHTLFASVACFLVRSQSLSAVSVVHFLYPAGHKRLQTYLIRYEPKESSKWEDTQSPPRHVLGPSLRMHAYEIPETKTFVFNRALERHQPAALPARLFRCGLN